MAGQKAIEAALERRKIKGYVTSMEYLLKQGTITVNTPTEKVYELIFDNISKLNNFYYWKNDLSLYMLVLSALIKSTMSVPG